jgi:lipoprotein NlpI
MRLASRLDQAMTQIDVTKWPAPVIRLYLGQTTPEAVLAAADDPDINTKKRQGCETNFFSGELALQRGAKDEAVHQFRVATADCGRNISWLVNDELKTFGVQP